MRERGFMTQVRKFFEDFRAWDCVKHGASFLYLGARIVRAMKEENRATNRRGVLDRVVAEPVKMSLLSAPEDELLKQGSDLGS